MIETHPALLAASCLRSLSSRARPADALSHSAGACALATFAANATNPARRGEEGGLQPLITLASSEDTAVHHQAVAAIRGLQHERVL